MNSADPTHFSSLSAPLLPSSSFTMNESIASIDRELAMMADNDASTSTSFCQRINPLHTLSFIKQRTIEHYHNLSLAELSGSLGDLGTFIPLTVALARERKIALAPALFWAGICNFVTGYLWDVPMCVQPMKSIAAVALTDVAAGTSGSTATGLDAQSVTTAGILSKLCFTISIYACVVYKKLYDLN